MAKPITRTIPLEGKEAEDFLKSARETENSSPTREESKRIKDSLDKTFRRFDGMKIIFNS